MKSFSLLLIIFFVGFIFCQQTQLNNFYNAINQDRTANCVNTPITVDSFLQSEAQRIANAQCLGQSFTNPPNTLNLNYNWASSNPWTYDDFYNTAKGVYDNSKRSWTCQGDLSAGDTNFIRFSLVGSQKMACAFSNLACQGNRYFFYCLFSTFPSTPVVPQCTCSGTNTNTNTGTTTTGNTNTNTNTNTGTTTTNNGVTVTTTIDANGNTVTTTTDANGNRWVTVTAPTNGNTANSASPSPTPSTTTNTNTNTGSGSSSPSPSPSPTPSTTTNTNTNTGSGSSVSLDSIKNGHMDPINAARSCLGVPALTWDDTLTQNARGWAESLYASCGSSHSFSTTTPARNEQAEGENIWQYWADNADQAIVYGTTFWNGEAAYYNCDTNTCSSGCGHYTQDISSFSTKIGCWVIRCPSSFDSFGKGKYTGVCRFGLPGNNGKPPLTLAGSCANFATCQARIKSTGRSLSTTSTTSTQNGSTSSPFFSSDSQIVVFALAIAIIVVVVGILILLLVSGYKRTTNQDLEFKLLESK